MVSTRRTRVLIVVAWVFIVGLLFVGFHKSQSSVDTSKFLDNIDEKDRLESRGPGAKGAAKDLTSDPDQPFSPEKEYTAILSESPIVIFSKSYCPHCKAVKEILLQDYQINPQPWVVELDKHPHGHELQEYIGAVTGRTTVPNVHVKRVSRGGGDEFREMHDDGSLVDQMLEWGGTSFRVKRLTPPN